MHLVHELQHALGVDRDGDERERLADGVTQHLLDCGLHEVATGDREDEASMTLRVEIARMLVECGADPNNRQHGCGGTPRTGACASMVCWIL